MTAKGTANKPPNEQNFARQGGFCVSVVNYIPRAKNAFNGHLRRRKDYQEKEA